MAKGQDIGSCEYDPETAVNRHNITGNGKSLKEKCSYVENQDKDKGKGISEFRNKTDKSISDRPTTASAQKGLKDLPAVIGQVGKAAVHLQNMYSTMSQVSSILSSMNSSGDNDEKPTPSSGKKKKIEDALTGALAILIKKWGYDRVIAAFDNALDNNGIKFIDEDYREIVINSLGF